MAQPTNASALGDLRVIELADRHTALCGKLLADMGADVVLVEPPGGAPHRLRGPFLGAPDPSRGARFVYENAGKRSVTADLQEEAGRESLHDLLAEADFFIEGTKPGALEALGLGYESLAERHPRLIVVSITDFGQDGPWAAHEATDLISMALGGVAYLGGFPDTAPARIGGAQASNIGGLHAACASMLALHQRATTGRGQRVDVSLHEAVAYTQEIAMQAAEYEGIVRGRLNKEENPVEHGVYRCSDGYIICTSIPRNWDALIGWMSTRGVDIAPLIGEEWAKPGYLAAHAAEFNAIFVPFLATMTRDEACDEAQAVELMFAPVYSSGDLVRDPQLESTNYFQERELWAGEPPVRYPGRAYDLSVTPWAGAGPVPAPGEHTDALLRTASKDGVR
ncbi:MAG: CoA transferase [Dehalococcoidia bacterium]